MSSAAAEVGMVENALRRSAANRPQGYSAHSWLKLDRKRVERKIRFGLEYKNVAGRSFATFFLWKLRSVQKAKGYLQKPVSRHFEWY